MPTEVIVYILTALAAVVVLLTRLRLGRGTGGAGRLQMGRGLVDVHTGAGVVALGLWVAFLVTGTRARSASWRSARGGSWSIAGLLILVRWLPSRGRHASAGREDSWSEGPGLSVLAHVGMLVGVGVFT